MKWRTMKWLREKWFSMKWLSMKQRTTKKSQHETTNEAVKRLGMGVFLRKQQLLKVGLGIGGCIIFALICFYAFADEVQTKPDRKYKTNLTGGSDRFSPQKAWFEQVTSKLEDITQRLSSLEGTSSLETRSGHPGTTSWRDGHSSLQGSSTLETRSGHSGATSLHSAPENRAVNQTHSDHLEISSSLSSESPSSIEPHPVTESVPPSTPITSEASFSIPLGPPKGTNGANGARTAGIHHVALSKPTTKTLKTGDNTIPAGAFAEGVLLGGVDASTSIQASSDPRPVLLRLTNPGTLPRRFKSDLCGCHVLAACYGDMSSERVFMRLEKITCTERKTGEIIEMNVKGYVAGEDGRAGLRGTLVDRAGESVRNAAIGGFIGGMAGFIGQANQNPVTYSLSSGLSQTPGLKGGDMLRQGAAKGAGNALEKYADFYIKRAEQMQPVIQVQAGRIVDIVTTESTPFEDSAERRSLIHINDRKRYEQIKLPPLGDTQTHSQEGDAS